MEIGKPKKKNENIKIVRNYSTLKRRTELWQAECRGENIMWDKRDTWLKSIDWEKIIKQEVLSGNIVFIDDMNKLSNAIKERLGI